MTQTDGLQPVRGFSLHAAVRVPAPERDRLERVARYILRPPFVHDRLSLSEDGKVLLQLLRPFADGTTALLFDPYTFLERLVAQVPRPRASRVAPGCCHPGAPTDPDVRD